jgi:hypothetical protein
MRFFSLFVVALALLSVPALAQVSDLSIASEPFSGTFFPLVSTSSVTLTWSAIAGAQGYEVQWFQGQCDTLPYTNSLSVNGPGAVVSGLLDNQAYCFIVNTVVAGNNIVSGLNQLNVQTAYLDLAFNSACQFCPVADFGVNGPVVALNATVPEDNVANAASFQVSAVADNDADEELFTSSTSAQLFFYGQSGSNLRSGLTYTFVATALDVNGNSLGNPSSPIRIIV